MSFLLFCLFPLLPCFFPFIPLSSPHDYFLFPPTVCFFAFLHGLAVARIPSLYLVSWGKMFLPVSSFFGKEQKGVERLRLTCETTVVNPRESPCLEGQGGLYIWMASLKWHSAEQVKRRKNEKVEERKPGTRRRFKDLRIFSWYRCWQRGKWMIVYVFKGAGPENLGEKEKT